MGVEFRLGRQDHKKVEDFLTLSPSGVSAVVLEPRMVRYQRAAAEAAADAGIDVLVDPGTERLTHPGFSPPALAYAAAAPYDLDRLVHDPAARSRLVRAVIAAQPDYVTTVTPPHFYVTDDRSAHLNLALAEETVTSVDRPTRPTLILGSRYSLEAVEALAKDFAAAGITRVELRLSPFGGEELSVRQIRSGFVRAQLFTTAGIEVTLGWSGIVGQTAMSRGIVEHYSVGIGLLEQVNHLAVINRQQQPPKPASPDGTTSQQGPVSGIYLPALALTVGRRVGAAMLADTDIRTRIGCRTGVCATTIKGPATDPRTHYLHAHAAQTAELLAQPAPWRAKAQNDRLRRAADLRRLVNDYHRPAGAATLHTRTLTSLLDDADRGQATLTG